MAISIPSNVKTIQSQIDSLNSGAVEGGVTQSEASSLASPLQSSFNDVAGDLGKLKEGPGKLLNEDLDLDDTCQVCSYIGTVFSNPPSVSTLFDTLYDQAGAKVDEIKKDLDEMSTQLYDQMNSLSVNSMLGSLESKTSQMLEANGVPVAEANTVAKEAAASTSDDMGNMDISLVAQKVREKMKDAREKTVEVATDATTQMQTYMEDELATVYNAGIAKYTEVQDAFNTMDLCRISSTMTDLSDPIQSKMESSLKGNLMAASPTMSLNDASKVAKASVSQLPASNAVTASNAAVASNNIQNNITQAKSLVKSA